MQNSNRQYNLLLQRHEKAVEYFDNPKIPVEEKEKYLPAYLGIVKELSKLIEEGVNHAG